VDTSHAIDLLSAAGSALIKLGKQIASDKPAKVIQEAIEAVKGYIESKIDVDLGMITSDLSQVGQLNSYSIMDLSHALDHFAAETGIVMKIVDMLCNGAKTLAGIGTAYTGAGLLEAVWAAKGLILNGFDLALEIIDLTPWASSFKDNAVYKIFETGVSWSATASDPNGTIIVPSVYDSSGALVLGYNSSSSDVIYASSEGILISLDGDWLAFLYENSSSPVNYTICLNAVGGNAPIPYNLQILSSNQNVTAIGYCGMILGGTSTTIQVNVALDGTLILQVYLEPALSVRGTGSTYDFVATGLLSNGSQALVTDAFLIFNGSQYEMTQDNSSTFETQITVNLPGNFSYIIYMISPNVPGGYATGVLTVITQYGIIFDMTGVGSDFTGTAVTIDGTNYTASGLPAPFLWDNGTIHKFAFQSPLLVGSGAKEYDWTSTTGLSTLQSDSITVTGAGNVTSNYVTRVHDVAVTSVLPVVPHCSSKVGNDSWVFQGRPVYVNVTISNNGNFDENVTITLYYNSTSSNSAKGINSPNILLSAGQTQTIVLVWNTTAIPYCLNYTITAVATIPLDNNPADNTRSCGPIKVRIMGDINGDGKVDGKDIVAEAISFPSWGPDFSYPGSPPCPRWNLDCDINCDNKIDGKDLVLVALNFGK
jgi:hypothetical protein